jgi:hypothetical protein
MKQPEYMEGPKGGGYITESLSGRTCLCHWFAIGGIRECERWRRLGELNTVPVGELPLIRRLLVTD